MNECSEHKILRKTYNQMPMGRRYGKKKAAPRRRPAAARARYAPKKRMYNRATTKTQIATCSETDNLAYATNTGYRLAAVSLDTASQRVLDIAKGYQMYRLKKITCVFKPKFDTFAAGGGNSVPEFHYIIDKLNSFSAGTNLQSLRDAGAKPIRFDDRNITISWRPSVLTQTFGQANPASQFKLSPWLSVNANAGTANPFAYSSIDHFGLAWQVNVLLSAGYADLQLEITLDWEFKKPLSQPPTGEQLVEGTPAVSTRDGRVMAIGYVSQSVSPSLH